MSNKELISQYIRFSTDYVKKRLDILRFVEWMTCVQDQLIPMCSSILYAMLKEEDDVRISMTLPDGVARRIKQYPLFLDSSYLDKTLATIVTEFLYDCGFRKYWHSHEDVIRNYELQHLVVNWMGYVLGAVGNNDALCMSAQYYKAMENVNLTGYYMSRKAHVEQIVDFWKENKFDSEQDVKILIGADPMAMVEIEKTADEVLNNLHSYPNAFSSYRSIDKYRLVLEDMLELQLYDDLVERLLEVRYPVLIYHLMTESLRDTNDVVGLLRCIKKTEISESKRMLSVVLLEIWYRQFVREMKSVMDASAMDKDTAKILASWKKSVNRRVSSLLALQTQIVGVDIVVQWVSHLRYIDKQIDSIEIKATNRCVEIIRLQQSKTTPLTVRGHEHDFDYLLYLASIWSDEAVDAKELWNALLCGIQNGEEKWYGTIDNIVLMNWGLIGRVLAVQDIEETMRAMQLLNVRYEGYNISEPSKIYESVRAECYMFGVVLMSIEKYNQKRKLEILRLVTENILSQCYYCQNEYIVEQYYYAPLLTVALLSDQKVLKFKNVFEKNVILSGLPIEMILKILSSSKHLINESNRKLLKRRLKREWEVQRIIMIQIEEKSVEALEKYIQRVIGNVI